MNAPRLTVATNDLEVEKPQGGGHGEQALYIVDVMIDGKHALTLHRHNFKEPGQMLAFVEALKARGNV